MSDPVLLPKFELPGEKPHWAVRAAWISAGVLLLAMVGLGAVIMHRHSLEMDAHLKREEAIARVKAEMEEKVAAAAAIAKATKEAELADKRATEAAAAAAKAAALAAAAPAGEAADGDTKAKTGKASHRSHSGHGGKASKTAAKTSPTKDSGGGTLKDNSSSIKASGSKSSKPDPIDEMLKKMK